MEHDLNEALDALWLDDPDLFRDFCDAFSDHAVEAEALIDALLRAPADGSLVDKLFRAFHSIKGDAAMCRLTRIVDLVHSVESLLSRLRDGELAFCESFGNVLLLVLGRLELVLDARRKGQSAGMAGLVAVWRGIDALAGLPPAGVYAGFSRLVDVMSGLAVQEAVPLHGGPIGGAPKTAGQEGDLALFRELAMQLEHRSALFLGRTERNLRLALETNRLAGGWIDAVQLEAAVYVHDIGMMLLPERIWLGDAPLEDGDRRLLQSHPRWASEWLARVPGWEAAAQMVLQHHEKPDGGGYPAGVRGGEIVPGAKILSLIDTFEAVMLRQLRRGHPRSLLRAAAEVNASDLQFDKAWVEPFNRAVHAIRDGD
ncbi:HD-GYP domain-containing protein [Paludibacterium paludis]|uniref:HD domain-containing protein n=1 Tax=Paludibacterium paludis TaxID=1225769 RepID=A0A918P747_9NEIS|nr:HD domain-containing phosphohydrolase [Paludibacterium paludis]GGY25727.1 hypothetical protein GCM10011289_31720 [Paludibacterium paludis]